MMVDVKQVDTLQELMDTLHDHQGMTVLSARAAGVPLPGERPFHYTWGWHFYTYLRFTQDIERATDHWQAQKQMEILKHYCVAARLATQRFSFAALLEVQGDVNHFFLDLDDSSVSVKKVERFASYLTSLVEARIKVLAPDDFQQYHQAADYGNSVLVSVPSFEEASASIISLGDCANRPAKQMGESQTNIRRPLWLPTQYVDGGDARTNWTAIETLDDDVCQNKRVASHSKDAAAFQTELRNVTLNAPRRQGSSSRLVLCHAQPLRKPHEPPATPDDPEIIDAFLFRADLDGFTAQVRDAFERGADAVSKLVKRFVKITRYVQVLKEQVTFDVVDLSWSGDCANFLVKLPDGESYETAAHYLPLEMAKLWYGLLDEQINGDDRTWREFMGSGGDIDWVLCPAGGRLFVADLYADGRTFRIASGWPTGISRDGVNREGTQQGWTVMHRENVRELAPDGQSIFENLGTDFKYAPFARIQSYKRQSVAAAAASAGATALHYGAKTVSIPRTLPYAAVRLDNDPLSTPRNNDWVRFGQIPKYTQVCFVECTRRRFGFTNNLWRFAPLSVDGKGPILFITSGRYVLPESGATVDLEIRIDVDYRIPPKVFAYAPWLSPYAKDQDPVLVNWHRYVDNSICYCHPEEWQEFSERHVWQSMPFLCEILTEKLYKDVTQWLRYHRCAFENGLKAWSPDWPAHPHGGRLGRGRHE